MWIHCYIEHTGDLTILYELPCFVFPTGELLSTKLPQSVSNCIEVSLACRINSLLSLFELRDCANHLVNVLPADPFFWHEILRGLHGMHGLFLGSLGGPCRIFY